MLQISRDDIDARLALDNPWWETGEPSALPTANMPHRLYFDAFRKLALNFEVKRAAILLGPRRVGKTVLVKQLAQSAMGEGIEGSNILYASIDTPLYTNLPLSFFVDAIPAASRGERCLIMFDEIQYLPDWQSHLKDLVDSYPRVKFVASGSASAALKLKSRESGAGRFSDFILPPLTFSEYVEFSKENSIISDERDSSGWYSCSDINRLNDLFIGYLNFGGYPEAVFNEHVRNDPDRFIRNDIVEKVLLNDLPSLYGITNIQELKKLFTVLAYNTGNETNYQSISQDSGISKTSIARYIEYLESAFLIMKISTVNENCRSMQRARNFKVYLSNPSMRAALFSPVKPDDGTTIGHLAESAVFSQWQHSMGFSNLRYARWNRGEVDVVYLSQAAQKAIWIGEIKWSDKIAGGVDREAKNLSFLVGKQPSIKSIFYTSKTISREGGEISGRPFRVLPTSLYCYTVGRNAANGVINFLAAGDKDDGE